MHCECLEARRLGEGELMNVRGDLNAPLEDTVFKGERVELPWVDLERTSEEAMTQREAPPLEVKREVCEYALLDIERLDTLLRRRVT